MKRLEEIRKNLKDGEILLCVEGVEGTDEISKEIFICDSKKEQKDLCKERNKLLCEADKKHYKYIEIDYTYNKKNNCLESI